MCRCKCVDSWILLIVFSTLLCQDRHKTWLMFNVNVMTVCRLSSWKRIFAKFEYLPLGEAIIKFLPAYKQRRAGLKCDRFGQQLGFCLQDVWAEWIMLRRVGSWLGPSVPVSWSRCRGGGGTTPVFITSLVICYSQSLCHCQCSALLWIIPGNGNDNVLPIKYFTSLVNGPLM